ncbi:AMP-binding enzyme [Halorussus caseinilyticus]|uniref:AMP-binding enzyme C-terminal domain-containing protein n=1 Tax=Halorussus caseinilyticus TaxID=3034025 RepID=A0ABD5WJX7_9EURY
MIIHRDAPGAFQGYLNDYENAGESFEDGWYFTGDACRETEEGHYVVTGRLSSRIKFGGDNIYPKNVETALASHPAVEDAAVVGIADDEWGEVPKAYVVGDDDLTAEELEDHCVEGDELEGYKRPREFEFVSALPENIDGIQNSGAVR